MLFAAADRVANRVENFAVAIGPYSHSRRMSRRGARERW